MTRTTHRAQSVAAVAMMALGATSLAAAPAVAAQTDDTRPSAAAQAERHAYSELKFSTNFQDGRDYRYVDSENMSETFNVTFDWKVDADAQPGDTVSIQLPDGMNTKADEDILLTNGDSRATVANFSRDGQKVVYTYTDDIKNYKNLQMHVTLSVFFTSPSETAREAVFTVNGEDKFNNDGSTATSTRFDGTGRYDTSSSNEATATGELIQEEPTASPSATSTPTATASPSATGTPMPTGAPEPTSEPTADPTTEPTSEPTASPSASEEPTASPSASASEEPTEEPSASASPSASNSASASSKPSDDTTDNPNTEGNASSSSSGTKAPSVPGGLTENMKDSPNRDNLSVTKNGTKGTAQEGTTKGTSATVQNVAPGTADTGGQVEQSSSKAPLITGLAVAGAILLIGGGVLYYVIRRKKGKAQG